MTDEKYRPQQYAVDSWNRLARNFREWKEEPMTIRDGPEPLPPHPLAHLVSRRKIELKRKKT